MDTRELGRIDLNLLISLQILMEERSVSRAAERLNITQPAMSKTLSRLRILFDDPLFTRSSRGMQPTPRATELATGLSTILGDISNLMSSSRFDPWTFDGEVVLALSEYIGVVLLPGLMEGLARQAPRLRVRVITRIENQLEELARGNLDFAIHIKQAHYGAEYRVKDLGGSPPAILVRSEHPLVGTVVSWHSLAQFPLISLYVSDWEQLEFQRNAAAVIPIADHPLGSLEISHLLTALEVLRHTDFFMPAPAYLLQQERATAGITGLTIPEDSKLSINYALVTHHRTANSPLHNWLWEQITCTIADLRAPLQRKLRQRITAGSAAPHQ
jgi:DNA-binding transcriptional LysR family regulator